jgi:hypothetical protein
MTAAASATGVRPLSWHTVTVPLEELPRLVAQVRRDGGVITSSRPSADGSIVTYVV